MSMRIKVNKAGKKILALAVLLSILGGYFMFSSKPQSCEGVVEDEKVSCVKENIDKYIEKRNISEALKYLDDYQKSTPIISGDCHGLAHYIGESAVDLYRDGVEILDADSAGVCQYGYYHAFMAALVRDKEFDKARLFCERLYSKHKGVVEACYHGIGHGAVLTFVEERGLSTMHAVVAEGRVLCDTVMEGAEEKVYWCLDGIYGGLLDVSTADLYANFEVLETPFDLCLDEREEFKEICYLSLSTVVGALSRDETPEPGESEINMENIFAKVLSSNKIENKETAIYGLALFYMVDKGNQGLTFEAKDIDYCRALPGVYNTACLKGMVHAVLVYPPFGEHFEAAKAVCMNDYLTVGEKKVCLGHVISKLRGFYSVEEALLICDTLEDPQKSECTGLYGKN